MRESEPGAGEPDAGGPAGADRPATWAAPPVAVDDAPADVFTDPDADDAEPYRDWHWVEQWRAERERPAWGPGITLALFVTVLVAVALLVLTSGLSDTPWLAVLVNVVIAVGMAPALWLSRGLPVLRFLAAGAAAGLLVGWISMLLTFGG